MLLKKNKTIFTDYVKINKLCFNYVDIGARGNIVSPWLELERVSKIIGFEPDSIEAKRLNEKYINRLYYSTALWSSQRKGKVYINEWEPTSSMYRPNDEFINKFHVQHWEGRRLKKEIDVECNTLDNVLMQDELIPDFIKIDTQGAELEILKGAERILTNYCPIVTCETWCAEVYKNAPMMHEVIQYMNNHGYQVFDMELAAAWKHGNKEVSSKRKSIGYEILFVKVKDINVVHNQQIIKLLLLLELYGYRDYAIFLMDSLKIDFKELDSLIKINNKNELKLHNKLLNKIIEKINKLHDLKIKNYPGIKY